MQAPDDRTGARLNREVQAVWETNAAWWDGRIGEGNDFQLLLLNPVTDRLLDIRPGERVLDIACGNGSYARKMAERGAEVLAVDLAEEFLRCARARTASLPADISARITYRQVDATDEAQLLRLGVRGYDAAVCNMALMDMVDIDSLMRSLAQLLRPHGRFVFSVCHPCFSQEGAIKCAEQEDRDGELVTTHSVRVLRYILPTATKGLGIVGQPVPQYYFHRPLSALLGSCLRAGFVLDALEEPVFQLPAEPTKPFSWQNYALIPPALIARLRPAARER